MKYKPHHKIQCINLDPDHLPVQTINSLENRKKFLKKVKKLYQFVGTRDMAGLKRENRYKRHLFRVA